MSADIILILRKQTSISTISAFFISIIFTKKIKMSNTGYSFRGSGLYGLIVTILTLIALYYVAKGAFWILNVVAPLLLIVTLVLDHKVVVDYFKMLWRMILNTPIIGILAAVLSVVAFPVVIFFLFGRAWFGYYIRKKQKDMNDTFQQHFQQQQAKEEEFVPYEEIKDQQLNESDWTSTYEPDKQKKYNQ